MTLLPPLASEATPPPAPFHPLQAIFALGGMQALTMAAGLGRTKVLALLLGPDGLGIAGVIDQTVSLVTHLGSLSFPFAALTFLSRRRSKGAESFARLYLAFFKVLLGASLAATAIAIGIAAWRTSLISEELIGYRLALIIGLAGAPALAAASFLQRALAAAERHHQAALFALLGAVALIGTSYAGLELGGLAGLYVGNLVVALAMVPITSSYLRRTGAVVAVRGRESPLVVLRSEPGLVGFCATIHLLSLFSPLAYLVARVAVLDYHGAAEAGLFAAGYGLPLAVRVVLTQANTLYLAPILNQATAKIERAEATAEYLRVLAALLTVAATAIVLFPREWLILLYSNRFSEAAPYVATFLLGEALLLIASAGQMLLIGFDDVRAHAWTSLAGQVVLAVVALLLVPSLASFGVALAFVAGHGTILLLQLGRLLHRHQAFPLIRSLRLLLGAFIIIGTVGWWVAQHPQTPVLWKLAAFLLIGGGSLRVLTADERRWILSPWRNRSRSKH